MKRSLTACVLIALLAGVRWLPGTLHAAPQGSAGRTEGSASSRPEAVPAPPEEAGDDLIRRTLRRGGNTRVRVTLIEQIEAKRRVEYQPELVVLLRDENAEVREASAHALGMFGWERISGPLLRIVDSTEEPMFARVLACRTLASTGRREAVEPMLALLDEPELAPTAAKGLAEITLQEFKSADDWRAWWAANKDRTRVEWALSRSQALEKKVADLEKELDAAKKRCADLENRAGDALIRSLDSRTDKKDPAPLLAALNEPDVKVKKYAAGELGRIKAKDAVKRLSDLAAGDESPALRAEYVAALAQIGSAEAAPALGLLLGDANEEVAAAAALSLGKLKAEAATNRLMMGLLHRSPAVRSASAEALGQIGGPVGVIPLIELLDIDKESSVRESTARALGEIGDVRARPALEKALNDPSPAVRVYAVEALGALKAPEVEPKLCAALTDDKSPSVRESAAVALGKVGGAMSVPVLVKAMEHPEEKLASLAWSSLVEVCRRDESLVDSTAEGLSKAGRAEQATTLYENLEKSLVEKKDEKGLTAARLKLADACIASKQWPKAQTTLEALSRALPGDAGVGEKYARTLTGLNRPLEAFKVYQALASHKENRSYWDERLALLETLLASKKTDDVTATVDAALKGEEKPPEEVAKKLEDLRRRAVEAPKDAEPVEKKNP